MVSSEAQEGTAVASQSVKVLLISGSTRASSSNSAALRAAAAIAPAGLVTRTFDGLTALPPFNPDEDHDPLPVSVKGLRGAVSDADAVLFCCPEYAGSLPGSFKNLLDWLVGGGELYGKPVGSINVAAEGRGKDAQADLRRVLAYLGASEVERCWVDLAIGQGGRDPDGQVVDPDFRAGLDGLLRALATHVEERRQ